MPVPSVSGGTTAIDLGVLSGAGEDSVRAADPQAESPGPEPAVEMRGPLTHKVWSSRIGAPEAGDDAETSLALKRLIRQVRLLTLNDRSPAPPSAPTVDPPAEPEIPAPVVTNAANIEPAPPEPVASAAPQTTPVLSPKTQSTLEGLQKNAGRVRDPLDVAELLFLSGRPTEAAAFYEEALRRTSAGDTGAAADRAWILFQLGNCLRETDATKAQDAYMKLIAQYPDSPWTEMARASGRLLTWYQSTRPDQLVARSRP
jgi:tetratricopeptide (TPR) repeat protein